MSFKIRRIVTAHDAQGRSTVGFDDLVESSPSKMQATIEIANIWVNERMPPPLDGPAPTAGSFPILPRDGGAIFRVLELAPGTRPNMHKTETIDYVVCTAGELTMLLEDGAELCMNPHDLMIQRATVHGWANRGNTPCRFVTVVVDAAKRCTGLEAGERT